MFTGGEAMMLARLAGCEGATAAQILAAFEPMSGAQPPNASSTDSRQLTSTVEQRRRWMRLDPHYRAARDALEQANG